MSIKLISYPLPCPDSGKQANLAVKSEMPEGFACGIRNRGLWNRNSAKEIWNPANDWNLDSSSTDKEFGIHSGESRIQDSLGLHGLTWGDMLGAIQLKDLHIKEINGFIAVISSISG